MAQNDNKAYLESILKRYRPENKSQLPVDIQYLMNDDISLVLSEGFNVLYRAQPRKPIDFFAKWLLNYESTQKNKKTSHDTEAQFKETIKKYDQAAEVRRKQEAEKEALRQMNEKYENLFRDKVKSHEYHEELLSNDLPSFIEKQKNLPAVYIGVLEHPSKAIADDEEDENAHLDTKHQKVITYIGASGSQKFVMGRELQPGKGVTYGVFQAKEEDANAAEGQEQAPSSKPNYIYVPDVTKNASIHYFRIPRLGAYMAVPLSYKSVLSERAFDAAVTERQRAQDAKAAQDKEKTDRDVEYEERIKEAKEAELDTKELEDEWHNVEWPEITEKEFETEERKFVLCVDTLGEDRGISEDERKYIAELAKTFVSCWEESERRQLSKDVDLYLQIKREVNKEEFLEELENKLKQEIEEKTAPKEEEEGQEEEVEEESEAQQNFKKEVITTEFYKKVLLEDRVKNMIKAMTGYRVVKFKSLIQNIMYFLGYKKGQVNVPGTNVLEWKELKKTIAKEDFFRRLTEYEYKGPKEGYWEKYALTNRLAQKLDKYNVDDIDEYNLGLGILYRYVKQVISTRLMDIELRRAQKAAEKAHREEQIQKEKDRNTAREQELEEAKNKATEEGTEFNQEEWEATWDEEHPVVVIPPEVIDDIDEDILEQD